MDSQIYTAFDGLYQELTSRIDHHLEQLATDGDMDHLDIVNELSAVRAQLHGEWMLLAHPRRQTRDTPQDAGPAEETADKDADKNVGGHGATEENRGAPEDGQDGPAKDRSILYYWFLRGSGAANNRKGLSGEPNIAYSSESPGQYIDPPDVMTYRDPQALAAAIAIDLDWHAPFGDMNKLTARIKLYLTGELQ